MRQIKINKSLTIRGSDSLEIYFQEIAREPLLTIDQEVLLAKKAKAGDNEAQIKLVKANLRFVISVSKQYQHRGLSLSDLISEGNIGLMIAAQRFDVTKGFRFISYAVWWIRYSILKAIHAHAEMIRIPLNRINERNKIMNANKEFEQEHERAPGYGELASILNLSWREISQNEQIPGKIVSYDATSDYPSEIPGLLDVFNSPDAEGSDSQVMKDSLRIELEGALAILKPNENNVLRSFFGLDSAHASSVDEIARVCKLSKARIRQIKDAAIKKLRMKKREYLLSAVADA